MTICDAALSGQERRITEGREKTIAAEKAGPGYGRLNRFLEGIRNKPPRIAVQRAALLTESMKTTEGLPLVLRWAKALEHIANNIDISIGKDELIVGRCGPEGRYGILYPELRGAWLETGLETFKDRRDAKFVFTEEDEKVVRKQILPYWKGRTVFEANLAMLPGETRDLLYDENDRYSPTYVLVDTTTDRSSSQWIPDYEKVLSKGFSGIRKEAERKLESLSVFDHGNNMEKRPFLMAVTTVCDAMVAYAKRYAKLAAEMASREKDASRKKELLEIAVICERVPENPARTFREALQAQWFTQLGFRFEQMVGGTVGNGRIDQYLYPFYKRDVESGLIDDEQVLILLEHLWLNMAQNITLQQSGAILHNEGVPHFEATTVGGQTRDGGDATNELSFLVMQSKKEFPLDYPDLAARIHSRTPESFLAKVCELLKEGTGFPKLVNDEAVVPFLIARGAPVGDARDYAVSGCTEVRMPNRDVYRIANMDVNAGAALEMALNDGRLKSKGGKRIGASTSDASRFETFEQVMDAFKRQMEYLVEHVFIQDRMAAMLRPRMMAAPLESSLHDLCMEQCQDIMTGKIEGGIAPGFWDVIGYATAVDSLAAVKKLVFDDKVATMDEMLAALENDFEGAELLRQRCLRAPKYGNNDSYADSIGKELENHFRSISDKYTNFSGGKMDVRYVPVTSHIPLGKMVMATPNGRKAKDPLSEGISPSQGCDTEGPTASLLSVAETRKSEYEWGGEGVLNMKLSPMAVDGPEGTRMLAALVRAWCDLKIWHIQFNVVNTETLKAAKREPEKFRNLLVRVAGYSAYFCDLSEDLQNEIIKRSEHAAAA